MRGNRAGANNRPPRVFHMLACSGYEPSWLFVISYLDANLTTIEAGLRPKEKEADLRTRRFPRYQVDLPVTLIKYWDDKPIAKARGRCHVLAEGGLGATVSAHDLYIGEVVRLEMPQLANVYASVRSNHGNRCGFEFVFMDESQRRTIRRFCETQPLAKGEDLHGRSTGGY